MTTVKFDHAVKYAGVRHAAHEVFPVKDSDIDALIKAGAIIMSAAEPNTPAGEADNESDEDEKPADNENDDTNALREELLGYTTSELTAFAKERGIDLQGKTRKADIYNVIVASLD